MCVCACVCVCVCVCVYTHVCIYLLREAATCKGGRLPACSGRSTLACANVLVSVFDLGFRV